MSVRGVHTWEGTATARWPWGVVVVAIVAATILGIAGLTVIGLIVLVASIPAMAFTKIVVHTGHEGLRIDYGPFGRPRQLIPIERIERAEVVDIVPLRSGGWGYRGALRLFGRASVNLRRGPGIALHLRDGKRFQVTVDEPAPGVSVLEHEIGLLPPPRAD